MYLGIDLGTSNSAIVGNDRQDLRLFKTTDGYDVLPSAIMIDRRGAIFVGRRAYDQDAFSPENVGKRFKRLMGTTTPIVFKASGRTMTPEQASSEVLKALLAQAQMSAGEFDLEGAIVTTPAAFNQMQCEATMRAAAGAGLTPVGLLQEPIAAAMASLADRQRANTTPKDGQFLIYDLGGGTFDVAIVQSVGGTVNIVGHGGVNMLGGTDFDRSIVNSIIRPWLLESFDLPPDFQKDPSYAHIIRIAASCAEKAKIEVSAQATSTIFADENQVGARDKSGRDIYLDIPLTRVQVESLVIDQIDRSIEVCRQLLRENGCDQSDIDRIVFIGGPTRMPLVRTRVPQQLGIPADLNSDPMTSVAFGAAIFAESREWTSAGSEAKKSRTTARSSGPVNIEYSYPERTSDSHMRIRVRPAANVVGQGLRLQLDSDAGWTSGQLSIDVTNSINDVPISRRGENHFRILVFDSSGVPIPHAEVRDLPKLIGLPTSSDAAGLGRAIQQLRHAFPNAEVASSLFLPQLEVCLPVIETDDAQDLRSLAVEILAGGAHMPQADVNSIRSINSWLMPEEINAFLSNLDVETTQTESAKRLDPAAFKLPGRPELERFFREYVLEPSADRERYAALGVKTPNGILLYGPTGSGKSHAVAKLVTALGWPMFEIDLGSVGSPFVHQTTVALRQKFDAAKRNAPALVVLEEIDAVASSRGPMMHDHKVEEVNEILRLVEGAAKNNILVIATTNRREALDPALLRKGRFDHAIEVGYPTAEEVCAALTAMLKDRPHHNIQSKDQIASGLAGRPMSDTAWVVNEAARLAARGKKDAIDEIDLFSALKRLKAAD